MIDILQDVARDRGDGAALLSACMWNIPGFAAAETASVRKIGREQQSWQNERSGGHPPHLMIQHFQEKSNSLDEISSFPRRIFHPFAPLCIKGFPAAPAKKSV
ncbi:MAG: hypothetical protein ACI4ML_04175 [Aristaeellaceae bacterium]